MTEVKQARIVSINHLGGRIELDDDTVWRVAYDHRPRILGWSAGTVLHRKANLPDMVQPYRLFDPISGISVNVTPSQGPSHWPWMQP